MCPIEVLDKEEWVDLDWSPEENLFKTPSGLTFLPDIIVRKDDMNRGHITSENGEEHLLRILRGAEVINKNGEPFTERMQHPNMRWRIFR